MSSAQTDNVYTVNISLTNIPVVVVELATDDCVTTTNKHTMLQKYHFQLSISFVISLQHT